MAYDNEAAILFNMGKLDDAVPVVDKAIAADPKKAINYYIKGQALIPKASVDPKTQKYILPPGCLEAYQEYLELAPDGQFANDVKQLLAGLGQPIVNGFKQKRR
jgi:tetratricopeptide (TPR) repeat protein